MGENDRALEMWHLALVAVVAGLHPDMPLPEGLTDAKLATLERLAGQARWRLKGERLAEKNDETV